MKKQLITIIVITAIGTPFAYKHMTKESEPSVSTPEVITLDLDHKEYDDVESLKADADIVLTGTVLGSRVISEQSVEKSVDGTAIPALPHTLYQVKVKQVLKGDLAANAVTVSQLGGQKDGVTYEIEGLTKLTRNTEVIVFLKSGAKDIYYPLAGGFAVATKANTADYSLPDEVNGEKNIRLNANAREM